MYSTLLPNPKHQGAPTALPLDYAAEAAGTGPLIRNSQNSDLDHLDWDFAMEQLDDTEV